MVAGMVLRLPGLLLSCSPMHSYQINYQIYSMGVHNTRVGVSAVVVLNRTSPQDRGGGALVAAGRVRAGAGVNVCVV